MMNSFSYYAKFVVCISVKLSISNVSVHICNDCVQGGGGVVFMEVEHLSNSGVVPQCLHAM